MRTVALIWEQGSDLGHVNLLLSLANGLAERGHTPVLVLRDLSRAHSILAQSGFAYLQAPIWLPPVQGLPPAANYTETLFRFGFLDPGLAGLIVAWRNLLELVSPDLMVFDQAPTALLATRGLPPPRLITGNSFSVPPNTAPLPPYKGIPPPPAARLAETEARAVRNCNAILESLGAPQISQVSDLFTANAIQMATLPKLDIYGPRPDALFCGPIFRTDSGNEVRWPFSGTKRVFAYLKPRYPSFAPMIEALSQSGASCLVFAPGLSNDMLRRLTTSTVAIHTTPLNMHQMCAESDLAVCHAGSIVGQLLSSAVPLLLLPTQREQWMVAQCVSAHGCGLSIALDATASELLMALKNLLTDSKYKTAAQAFTAGQLWHDGASPLQRLLDTCDELMRPTGG